MLWRRVLIGMMAYLLTPLVGSGAGTSLTFTDSNDATLIARKGAGAHTNTGALSEALTAAGQKGTLWVHIPEEVWASASTPCSTMSP